VSRYSSIDLEGVKTYPLGERKNKVQVQSFARPCSASASFRDFVASLPDILAGRDFVQVVEAVAQARRNDRPVIFAMGAHVIKCGLGPVLIDLMQRGAVTAIALNGAGAIHDFEVALIGETSEDVAAGLRDGTFGMAEETGRLLNEAVCEGVRDGTGMGEAVGKKVIAIGAPFQDYSILATGVKIGIPVTVHVAIGADIVHMHPHFDGAATGEMSLRDFRLLISVIADLQGGVYLNVGSAVLLPEVFLKALNVARNLGHDVTQFTTVNLDMYQHYRPLQNVVSRPVFEGGRGYAITGHHELMIPLLALAVLQRLAEVGEAVEEEKRR